jgi:hypothetical protein
MSHTTYNKNPKSSFETIKSQHHVWATGVMNDNKKREFHPYTHIKFKFKTK